MKKVLADPHKEWVLKSKHRTFSYNDDVFNMHKM